jgi:hypothetical protein
MDCRTARLLLDFARPRPAELPADEAAALEGHLTGCPECEAAARAERQLDDHLGRAVRAVHVPEGLRGRLLDRLAADRRAWRRRWVKRGAGALALAASVVLGVGLWWHWHDARPPLSTQDFSEYTLGLSNTSPEKVEDWFKRNYGLTVVAPREFDQRTLNYELLVHYDLGFCHDRQVPVFLFAQIDKDAAEGKDRMRFLRVCVVSARQFNNLQALAAAAPENSQGCTVEVRHDPNNPDVFYVLVYTSDSLRLFLSNEPRQAA